MAILKFKHDRAGDASALTFEIAADGTHGAIGPLGISPRVGFARGVIDADGWARAVTGGDYTLNDAQFEGAEYRLTVKRGVAPISTVHFVPLAKNGVVDVNALTSADRPQPVFPEELRSVSAIAADAQAAAAEARAQGQELADIKAGIAQAGAQAVDLGTQALEQAGRIAVETFAELGKDFADATPGNWAYAADTRKLYRKEGPSGTDWVQKGDGAAPGALTSWLANTDTTQLDPRDPNLIPYLGNQVGRAQLRLMAAKDAPEVDGVRVFPTASPDHVLVRSEFKQGYIWSAEEFGVDPRRDAAWNTARLQKALDALAGWTGGSNFARSQLRAGGRILLPQGEFELGRVVLRSQVDIVGSGPVSTRIIPAGLQAGQYLFDVERVDENQYMTHVGLEGFSISPNPSFNGEMPNRPNVNGINLKYSVASYPNRVWVYNIAGTAMNMEQTMDCYTADLNFKYCGTAVDKAGKTGWDADPDTLDISKSSPAVRLASGTNDLTNAIHSFGWRIEKCHLGMWAVGERGLQLRENHWVACKFEEAPVYLGGMFNCKFIGTQFTHRSYVKVVTADAGTTTRGLEFHSSHWTGEHAHLDVKPGAAPYGVTITGGGAGLGSVRPLRGGRLRVSGFEAVSVTAPVVEGNLITVSGSAFFAVDGDVPAVKAYSGARIVNNEFGDLGAGRAVEIGSGQVTGNRGTGSIVLTDRGALASGNEQTVSGDAQKNVIRDASGYAVPLVLPVPTLAKNVAQQNTTAHELEVRVRAQLDGTAGESKVLAYVGPANDNSMVAVAEEGITGSKSVRTLTLRVGPGEWFKVDGYDSATLTILIVCRT